MKPQSQLRKEPTGDCLRACVATLLEIKIDKAPDWTKQAEELMMPGWYAIEKMQDWLSAMGLFYLEIALPPNMPWNPLPFPALCILLGETTTGVKHAIVGRCDGADFFPVFNPWPEAEFAAGVAAVGFILPRDPAMPIKLGMSLEKVGKFAGSIPGAVGEAIVEEVNQTFHRQQGSLDGLIA